MLTHVGSGHVKLAECDIEVLYECDSHVVLCDRVLVYDSHELVYGLDDLLPLEMHMRGTPGDQIQDFSDGALGTRGVFEFQVAVEDVEKVEDLTLGGRDAFGHDIDHDFF